MQYYPPIEKGGHTPRLNIQSDDTLRCRLCLPLLLLPVRCQIRFSNFLRLLILFLIVTSKQVIILLFLLSGSSTWCILGIDGLLSFFGTVGCVCLRRIARERRKFGYVACDVLVPAISVGIFGDIRALFEGFEGGDVCL